jgi:hypothetical protein
VPELPVADVERAQLYTETHFGFEVVDPLEDKLWRLRQFTVEDLDGNRFYIHGG